MANIINSKILISMKRVDEKYCYCLPYTVFEDKFNTHKFLSTLWQILKFLEQAGDNKYFYHLPFFSLTHHSP